jgi:purine-binding chemotaxis protein CheW
MTIGQINKLDWESVRERLGRASEALTFSERDSEQHDAITMQARIRNLARVPQERIQDNDQLEVLTFQLGGESYALEAKYVHEIMAVPELALVPGTSDFLVGVINLRGEVLAIFDLHRLFGLPIRETRQTSRLIVLGETNPQFGFIADAVEQVMRLEISALTSGIASSGIAADNIVQGLSTNALIMLDGRALLMDGRLMVDQREDGTGA